MLSKEVCNVKKVISKLPKWFLFLQGVPYFCLFVWMIELILEMNIFNIHINTDIITTLWCFYCVSCVHIVGGLSIISSLLAMIINFKTTSTRRKYIIYIIVHFLLAWFTWFWFNALMSV